MTIREMCEAFDVTPRTLRFYEAKELLFPIREGQKRLFTSRDRARLKLILRGKKFGFALEEIRQLLDIYNDGQGADAQLRAVLKACYGKLDTLKEERDRLLNVISDLEEKINWGETQLEEMDRTGKVI